MSTKSLTFINHYKILGLWPSTTLDEIKKQYRNKYKLTHPDKNPNSDTADQFQVVNKAYNILSDKNSKNNYDRELFNWALKNHDNNIIIAFLNQNIKFNINENDNIGNTPLHIAIISNNNINIIKFLFFKGANIQAKNNSGNTPLHIAISDNNICLVEFLLNKGASTQAKNNSGNTPLHIAISNKNIDIVKLLLTKSKNIWEKNNDGITALHYACIANDLEIADLLIKHHAEINEKDNEGNTPLYYAIINQADIKLVHLLLNKGADIKIKNKMGDNSLKLSQTLIKNDEVTCLLLEKLEKQTQKKLLSINKKIDDIQEAVKCLQQKKKSWFVNLLIKIFSRKDIQNKFLPKNNELQKLLSEKEMIDKKMNDLKYIKINLMKLPKQQRTSRYKLNLPPI